MLSARKRAVAVDVIFASDSIAAIALLRFETAVESVYPETDVVDARSSFASIKPAVL